MSISIVSQTVESQRCVYGLEIRAPGGNVFLYVNISAFREDAEELCAKLLNAEDLSVLHLDDIVYDYLTELYYRKLRQNGFKI